MPPNGPQSARSPSERAALLESLQANVGRVFLGKPEVIRLACVALLADGHILLDDVPGVGKTLLAAALAYRVVFDLIPLIIALGLFALYEAGSRRGIVGRLWRTPRAAE